MKQATLAATTALFLTSMLPAPVIASEESDKAAAAALVLLGAAALAHHDDHYRDGYRPATGEETADFERGYRDGLHNAAYDSRRSTAAYGAGFDAGHKERANRLAYKRQDTSKGAPNVALRTCVGEASAQWGRNPRDIHVVGSATGAFSQAGGQEYQVEVAAGHKHGVCTVNAQGSVFSFRSGRL